MQVNQHINGNEWIITTHLNNIQASQEYIRLLRKDSSSIVDSLIEDRKNEAKIEFAHLSLKCNNFTSFPIDKFPDINTCNYSSIRSENENEL